MPRIADDVFGFEVLEIEGTMLEQRNKQAYFTVSTLSASLQSVFDEGIPTAPESPNHIYRFCSLPQVLLIALDRSAEARKSTVAMKAHPTIYLTDDKNNRHLYIFIGALLQTKPDSDAMEHLVAIHRTAKDNVVQKDQMNQKKSFMQFDINPESLNEQVTPYAHILAYVREESVRKGKLFEFQSPILQLLSASDAQIVVAKMQAKKIDVKVTARSRTRSPKAPPLSRSLSSGRAATSHSRTCTVPPGMMLVPSRNIIASGTFSGSKSGLSRPVKDEASYESIDDDMVFESENDGDEFYLSGS